MDVEVLQKTEKKEKQTDIKKIMVYNDDVNSFDHVIRSFVEVCGHDPIQAEQCSVTIHYNGKCGVKTGDVEELTPMCIELLRRKINAKIE